MYKYLFILMLFGGMMFYPTKRAQGGVIDGGMVITLLTALQSLNSIANDGIFELVGDISKTTKKITEAVEKVDLAISALGTSMEAYDMARKLTQVYQEYIAVVDYMLYANTVFTNEEVKMFFDMLDFAAFNYTTADIRKSRLPDEVAGGVLTSLFDKIKLARKSDAETIIFELDKEIKKTNTALNLSLFRLRAVKSYISCVSIKKTAWKEEIFKDFDRFLNDYKTPIFNLNHSYGR